MKRNNYLLLIVLVCNTFISSHGQCWKSVSVGQSSVLGITEDNKLWGWGNNSSGQLGDGTFVSKNQPVQIGTDSDWKMVSVGIGTPFVLALKNNGTLWAWGYNYYGQLGDGTFISKNYPVQIGTDSDWKTISAGYSHSMAVKLNGTLWTWGNNELYALGSTNGLLGPILTSPTQLGTLTSWNMVSAGDRFSLALNNNGIVYAWGSNGAGQLGIVGSAPQATITPRVGPNVSNTKYVTAGFTNSFDVKNDTGLLKGYGGSAYGELGGTSCAGCPVYYVKEVDFGEQTSAIIKLDGTLWYSGKKLGYVGTPTQYVTQFQQLGTASNWSSVSVGLLSAAAIDLNGNLYTWGSNYFGCLGIGTNGTSTNSLTLVSVNCPTVLSNVENSYDTISISPNPVDDYFVIISENRAIEEVILSDITGKILIDKKHDFDRIDVSFLQEGVYFVQIRQNNTIKNLRLIKK